MSMLLRDLPDPSSGGSNLRTTWENFKRIALAFRKSYYTSQWSSISDVLAAIGDDTVTLHVNSTVTVSSNTTIPANVSVVVMKGGAFAIATGVTLAIQGSFQAGLFQVFSGSGAVAFSSGSAKHANPQWWGADASGANDSDAAIQAAIDCGIKRVAIPNGTYKVATTLAITNKTGLVLEGAGIWGTSLVWAGAAGGTVLRMRGSWFCTISNMAISCDWIADTAIDLPCYLPPSLGGTDANVSTANSIRNIKMGNTRIGTTGVVLRIGDAVGQQVDNLTIAKCWIENGGKLVTIQGNVTFFIHFTDNCVFSGYDAIPTTVGIEISDRAGLVRFDGAQFVGNGPTVAYVTRADNCGPIAFVNCEMESTGAFFKGLDDTGFANTWPVLFDGCTIGYTGNYGTFGVAEGSPVITKTGLTGTNFYSVGQGLSGTYIPAGATISSIDRAAGTITLSANVTGIPLPATTATVAVTPTFSITSGYPNAFTPNTAIYTAGQRVSGIGIPANTRILSVDPGVKIVLTNNATATNTAASLTIVPWVIDYKQRGAVTINGGGINGSADADAIFYGPGSVGSVGGLVHEIGGRYVNVNFKTFGCSQLYQTSPIGGFTLGSHLALDGATGALTARRVNAMNGLYVAGGAEVASGDTILPNNAPVNIRDAAGTALEMIKLDASNELQIGGGLAGTKGFTLKGRSGANGLSMAGATGKMTLGPSASTQIHDINGGVKVAVNSGNIIGGGPAIGGVNTTVNTVTVDSQLSRHIGLKSGGGAANVEQCTQTTDAIPSSTATAICGLEGPSLVLVLGSNGSDQFMDLLITTNNGTPTKVSSVTIAGSPGTRTYDFRTTPSPGYDLRLSVASGPWTTNVMWFQMTFR